MIAFIDTATRQRCNDYCQL